MASGDGNRNKLRLHRDAWTLASRDQSLEKKRKPYYLKLLPPITTFLVKWHFKMRREMMLKWMRRREHDFFGTTFVWQRNHSWLGPQIWTWNRVVTIVLTVVARDKTNVSPRRGDHALTLGLFQPSRLGNLIMCPGPACLTQKGEAEYNPKCCIYIPFEALISGFCQSKRNTMPNSVESQRK